MDQHELRRKWLPADETALREAFASGMLEERNWCDLKRQIGDGKAANSELARDLASFAVDGGTLLLGVDEDAPGGEPLYPLPLAGLCERIEQVAATRVQPPLQVECTVIPTADGTEGSGYVLIHVPASPLAPHQVEGSYYGRGDKTKRRLTDPEVERLFTRRTSWSLGVHDELHRLRATRRSAETTTPQLYAVARPVAAWPNFCRPIVGVVGWETNLRSLRSSAVSDESLRAALHRLHGAPSDPYLGGLQHQEKTPTGARLTARTAGSELGTGADWRNLDLEIDESGAIWLFAAKVGEPDRRFNGITFAGLYVDVVASLVRELLIYARLISESTGHVAGWDVGVTITNLTGTRAISNSGTVRATTLGLYGNGYEAAEYTGTARASARQLTTASAEVTELLLGLLARSLHADTYIAPLLTSPRPEV